MFEGPLEDRLLIGERIATYSDAVFRRDAEAWIACWSEDGVWRVGGAAILGKAQILSACTQGMEPYATTLFFSMPGAIRVAGAKAEARVYTQEVLVRRRGKTFRVMGMYEDQLVKESGVWLFAQRTYIVLHHEGDDSRRPVCLLRDQSRPASGSAAPIFIRFSSRTVRGNYHAAQLPP